MRWLIAIAVLAAATGCHRATDFRSVDPDLIRVSTDARLRTDTVGEPQFAASATFVLVDADNTGSDGALITLGGELADAHGAMVGTLAPESLWVPGGGSRTFALVDRERKPRPSAAAATIRVRGAVISPEPPDMHLEDVHTYDDYGKQVIAATLVNTVNREGAALVIASFHDDNGKPMTRPFTMVPIGAGVHRNVQLVGPQGSRHAAIYVGQVEY